MGREIKFRAVVIDDDGNERLEYNVWPTGPSPGMRHLRGFIDNGGFWMDCKRFEQFTGLKDKNGKEIYEGDIVECDGYKMTVQWNERFACFCLMYSKWMYPHFFGEAADNDECEVIGNIYENAELLK